MKKPHLITSSKILKNFISIFSLFVLLSLVTLSVISYKKLLKDEQTPPHSQHANLVTEIKPSPSSIISMESPGLSVFKNLFFNKNHFTFVSSQPADKMAIETILDKDAHYNYYFTASPSIDDEHPQQHGIYLDGTTLIFCSSHETKSMQTHYFHFCEEFILGWSAFRHCSLDKIQNIIFMDLNHWEGRSNLTSYHLITALLPHAKVMNKSDFINLSKNNLIQFENAIIVDRLSCHQSKEANQYNKMLIGHLKLIKPEYIQEIRDALFNHLKTYSCIQKKPYITYIERSSRRFLDPKIEKQLLTTLETSFPQYTLKSVKFENLTFAEQIQIIRNTKILIGVHGNGLTHELFLPSNSLVLEFFPSDDFAMDYQLFSELANHHYFAIDAKNGVIAASKSRHLPQGNVNQVIHELNIEWFTQLIDQYSQRASVNEKSLELYPLTNSEAATTDLPSSCN